MHIVDLARLADPPALPTASHHQNPLSLLFFSATFFSLPSSSQHISNHRFDKFVTQCIHTMAEPIKNRRPEVAAPYVHNLVIVRAAVETSQTDTELRAHSTPQNTPASNAPISSHAQQPAVASIKEGELSIPPLSFSLFF